MEPRPLKAFEIPLTRGFSAIVDEIDYENLSQFNWSAQITEYQIVYAVRQRRKDEFPGSTTILMHREILDAPIDSEVDHISGNGLDNRRANLRLCSRGQNSMNSRLSVYNTSGYKGVSYHRRRFARIKFEGKSVFLGRFDSPEEAAGAYDEAALELFGEFAKTNLSLGLLSGAPNDSP